MNYAKDLEYPKMKLTDPLLHCLHRVCEKENKIKFFIACKILGAYVAMSIYDDRPI